jgi:hypothetical protein
MINRALTDLHRIGLWPALTKGLAVLQISTEIGHRPEDPLGITEITYSGTSMETKVCQVHIYPNLVRRNVRHASVEGGVRGLAARLLGHEISHCLGFGHGEPFARMWGGRVGKRMERLQ